MYVPLGHSPHVDLVADFGDEMVRVHVKTSISWRDGRWHCDFLFAHVGDGRRWYIPVSALGGGSGILLGGPKYAEFEIEPGDRLPLRGLLEPVLPS